MEKAIKIKFSKILGNEGISTELTVEDTCIVGSSNTLFNPINNNRFDKIHFQIIKDKIKGSFSIISISQAYGTYYRAAPNVETIVKYESSFIVGRVKIIPKHIDSKCVFYSIDDTGNEKRISKPLFKNSSIKLGRNYETNKDNIINIDEKNVSYKQTRIKILEAGVAVTDLASTNGTWIQFDTKEIVDININIRAEFDAYFTFQNYNMPLKIKEPVTPIVKNESDTNKVNAQQTAPQSTTSSLSKPEVVIQIKSDTKDVKAPEIAPQFTTSSLSKPEVVIQSKSDTKDVKAPEIAPQSTTSSLSKPEVVIQSKSDTKDVKAPEIAPQSTTSSLSKPEVVIQSKSDTKDVNTPEGMAFNTKATFAIQPVEKKADGDGVNKANNVIVAPQYSKLENSSNVVYSEIKSNAIPESLQKPGINSMPHKIEIVTKKEICIKHLLNNGLNIEDSKFIAKIASYSRTEANNILLKCQQITQYGDINVAIQRHPQNELKVKIAAYKQIKTLSEIESFISSMEDKIEE